MNIFCFSILAATISIVPCTTVRAASSGPNRTQVFNFSIGHSHTAFVSSKAAQAHNSSPTPGHGRFRFLGNPRINADNLQDLTFHLFDDHEYARQVEQWNDGIVPMRFKAYTRFEELVAHIPELQALPEQQRLEMLAASKVWPFRVNEHVISELIHWDNIPHDPLFQLTFPQPGMLEPEQLREITHLLEHGASDEEINRVARKIQIGANPHPSGQLEYNLPILNGKVLHGLEHKYGPTVLYFPSEGQTCHTYCTYCFRWAQFVGIEDLKIAGKEVDQLVEYLLQHKEVKEVLVTGGDPAVMNARRWKLLLDKLRQPGLEHVQTIRIGTKAVSYWPYRFVPEANLDPKDQRDAQEFLDLINDFNETSGKRIAFMLHLSHPRELLPLVTQRAIQNLQDTGSRLYAQAPVIRHVNDEPRVWAALWHLENFMEIVPYYMFVERDTGPKGYFQIPLVRAWEIHDEASRMLPGFDLIARGPIMSTTPGKVQVVSAGFNEFHGKRYIELKFENARNPAWMLDRFYAEYDEHATWLDQLVPAFGAKEFFYQEEERKILQDIQNSRQHAVP